MAEKKQNIIGAVKNYGLQLFGFIRSRVSTHEDAEDILQDVWYQLSSQAKLDDIESISGWLYRVARNRITDTYRKKKNRSQIEEISEEENEDPIAIGWLVPSFMQDNSGNPETIQLQKIFREKLFEAMEELPEKQRNVFIWNELDDMTLAEIAEREKENIKTIISRKRYAVQHLRKRLDFLYNEFLND